jgi:hypothetical protein
VSLHNTPHDWGRRQINCWLHRFKMMGYMLVVVTGHQQAHSQALPAPECLARADDSPTYQPIVVVNAATERTEGR